MAEMVRKQIYISRRQKALLSKLAKERCLSEAEIVRQAIDREARHAAWQATTSTQEAWEQAHQLMLAMQALGPLENQPRRWRREDIYKEQPDYYGQRSD